jgi:peptidoglycan hydrolase-like protein with peptidoglycan-binding domain
MNKMDVSTLQRYLNTLGYGDLDIDNILGRKTRHALKKYQNAMGLKPTGKIDEMTIKSFELKWHVGHVNIID